MRKPRIFYGYWIIFVAFLCLFFMSGSVYFSFSLFITPLQTSFGWGRGYATTAYTVCFLILAVASPFVGKLLDRYGPRIMIPLGALIFGAGFALLSTTSNIMGFYVFYAIVGVGMALIGPIPTSAVVSNWFKKRRGLALGIMSTGVGAGGLALAPIIGGYLIPAFGWRTSYMVLAILAWVLLIPLSLIVIRAKPSVMRLYPDGITESQEKAQNEVISVKEREFSFKKAMRTPAFWLIALSFFAGCLSLSGITQSQAPHLEDINFPVVIASGALGIIGLGSLVGKFGFGWLCDWIKPKYAWSIGLVFGLIGITLLMYIRQDSPLSVIWIYAVLIGLSGGAYLPTMSMATSRSFGLTSYGAIFGFVNFAQSAGVSVGPLIAGYMYDALGNYDLAFIIMLVLAALAIFSILLTRYPR
ncbi:MFS transporter [Chloroflexota bacterium]